MHAATSNKTIPMRISAGVVALVDDDVFLLRALRRALAAYGYRVKTFSSAEQYLEEAQASEISCAVFDIHLSTGMSGLELARAISGSSPSTPIIFMSGAQDAALRARAYDMGGVAFLDKPFFVSALVAEIMKLDSAND